MTTRLLTTVSAVIEAATGIALIAVPELVARVLLGAGLSDSGMAVGRLPGCALLSLGLACWPTADSTTPRLSGLLWPACALHAGLALLFARPAYGKVSAAKEARASKW